jgi:hypothetical protein
MDKSFLEKRDIQYLQNRNKNWVFDVYYFVKKVLSFGEKRYLR